MYTKYQDIPGELNPFFKGEPKFSPYALTQCYMRYALALQFAEDKDVVDASCGSCYGSALLSMRAKTLTCANISEDEMRFGRENFQFHCPATFHGMDFNVSFPEGRYDTIVSFETIEHLTRPEILLKNIKGALRPDGIFVFSVPLTRVEGFHKQEILSIEAAQNLIEPFFPKVKWYYQDNDVVSSSVIPWAKDWIGVYRG